MGETGLTLVESVLVPLAILALGGLGYLLAHFVIQPLLRLIELRMVVQSDMIYYANTLANFMFVDLGFEAVNECSKALRRHAADLRAMNTSLAEEWLRIPLPVPQGIDIPTKREIEEAAASLIYVSNAVLQGKAKDTDLAKLTLLEHKKRIQENLYVEIDKDIDQKIQSARIIYHVSRQAHRH